YFMCGAILATLALFIFPNVGQLWMAALLLWLLDASINISMEPFRAFVGDMLPDEQRTTGFAMQSFFIGIGAVISSILPYILTAAGISNEPQPGMIPDSVKISFYIGAVVFLIAVAYTVFTTREYSPQEMKSFGMIENESNDIQIKTPSGTFLQKGFTWVLIGSILSAILFFYNRANVQPLEKELYVLTGGATAFGLFQLIAG